MVFDCRNNLFTESTLNESQWVQASSFFNSFYFLVWLYIDFVHWHTKKRHTDRHSVPISLRYSNKFLLTKLIIMPRNLTLSHWICPFFADNNENWEQPPQRIYCQYPHFILKFNFNVLPMLFVICLLFPFALCTFYCCSYCGVSTVLLGNRIFLRMGDNMHTLCAVTIVSFKNYSQI